MKELKLAKLERLTPEYFKELSKKCYEKDRVCPENFSNWYTHIVDFGNFKHANIISNQIFILEEVEMMQETDNIEKVDWNKINTVLKPTLDKMEPRVYYNIKNGCFSNKYDFQTCLATKEDLAQQLWKVNYQSSMYETGGYTEVVVREIIPNHLEYPSIYNGMPLREESRVFYNMDTKEIEYMVDYWNYDYCYENLSITDKIIFDWFHNKIGNRETNHQQKLSELFERIEKNIHTIKFDKEIKGIWSIDFLWEQNTDNIYLIDMARGFRSTYWDEEKLKLNSIEQK